MLIVAAAKSAQANRWEPRKAGLYLKVVVAACLDHRSINYFAFSEGHLKVTHLHTAGTFTGTRRLPCSSAEGGKAGKGEGRLLLQCSLFIQTGNTIRSNMKCLVQMGRSIQNTPLQHMAW